MAQAKADFPRPIAIVGAGFLGSALAQEVGPPALVTTRSGRWAASVNAPDIRVCALDVCDDPLEAGSLRAIGSLVIAYAPGRTQPREELYVEGTRRLLEAVDRSALQRIIYIGSTSAAADRDGWVDESDLGAPSGERGEVQRRAEAVVRRCSGEVPWFVLRLGGLYGPGRALDRIYKRRQTAPLRGHGHVPTNLIHRDDAVAAIIAALAAPSHLGGVVHVCDDDHRSRREMYARIAAVRGESDPPSGGVEFSEPLPAGPPQGKRVSNLRLKTDLAVRLRFPLHTCGQKLRD